MLTKNEENYSLYNLDPLISFHDLEAFFSKKKNYLLSLIEKNTIQREREKIFCVLKTLNDLFILIQTIKFQDFQACELGYPQRSIKTIKNYLTRYIEKNIDIEIILKYLS